MPDADAPSSPAPTFTHTPAPSQGADALLRYALEAAGVSTWAWDLATDAVEAGPLNRALWGFSPDEPLMAAAYFARIHADDVAAVRQHVEQALADCTDYHADFRIISPAREGTRWVAAHARVECDAEGRPLRIVGVNYDVTERREADEALRASTDNAAYRIALADALRPLEDPHDIQAEAARLLGEHLGAQRAFYAEAEPDGRHVVVHRDYHARLPSAAGRYALADFGAAVVEAAEAGQSLFVDEVAREPLTEAERAAYEALGVRAYAAISLVKEGRLVALLGLHYEAPHAWTDDERMLVEETAERTWAAVEHARAEATLREREARYRALFEAIDEGYCLAEIIADGDGTPVDYRFLEVNPLFETMTGLVGAVGRTAYELVPDLEPHWVETYARVAFEGKPLRFESGSAAMGRWFDVFATPVEPRGRFALVFKDVTDRRQAEARSQLLAETGRLIEQALDYEGALQEIARLAVPGFADWCAVDLLQEDGAIEAATITHADPEKVRWGWQLRAQHPVDPDAPAGAPNVIRTGRPELYPHVTEEMLQAAAKNDDELALLREIGYSSVVIAPLAAEGRVVGAVTFANTESGRHFGPADLAAAEEIGRRAGALLETARLHESLRQSEALVRTIAENSTQGLVMMDDRGYVTYCNQAWLAMTGYDADEIRSKPLHYLVHHHYPDGRPYPMEECPIDRALPENFDVRAHEDLFFRKDGTTFLVLCAASPVFRDGRPVSTVIEVRDVTAEKAAEAALRESETRFRRMADTAPALLWVTEPEGRCTFLSKGWYEFTGQSAAEALGLGWTEAIHPDDRAAAREAFLTANARREPFRIDYRLRRHDGAYRWAIDAGRPRFDDDGAFLGFVGSVIDIHDRKAAEEALRRSEAIFRRLAESNLVGVGFGDSQGHVAYVNDEMLRMMGYTRADYEAGRVDWNAVIAPEYREEAARTTERLLREGRVSGYERAFLRPDGGRTPYLGAAALVVPGEDFHVSIALDLTQIRAAEEALRAREAEFSALANNIPQLAWMTDETGAITWYNQRWYEYTGTTFETMQGWGWQAVHHPDYVERVTARFKRHIEAGEPWEDVFPLRSAQGEWRWVLSRAQPIRDAEGRVVRWFGTNTDVTQQRELEQALRESEARFRTLAEALPDIVYTADAEGRVDYLNPRWYDYTGQAPTRSPAEVGPEAMHPDDAARVGEAWARALKTRRIFEAELRLRRHDGAYRWFLTRVVPLLDDQGQVMRWFGTSTDIHTQKALEAELSERVAQRTEALESANQQLAQRNRELQDFAYVASHDLQEPLRKIQAFSDLLVKDYGPQLDDQARFFLGRMQSAAARMSQLISDLLAFSRVATHGLPFEPVDLGALVQEVVSDLEIRLRETEGEVVVAAPLPRAHADAFQLRQLVQNLLSNGLKFHREGVPPVVRVAGETVRDADGRWLVLTVEDNGIGFEARYADRIFAPFQRLHGQGRYEGTGIGLAICRRIAERHGGTIAAESTPGAGSRFVVRLPAPG